MMNVLLFLCFILLGSAIYFYIRPQDFVVFLYCFLYRISPKKFKEASKNAKRKLDDFLDEEVDLYNVFHRQYTNEQETKKRERDKAEAEWRKFRSQYNSYWEEPPKFSQPSPTNMMEKHQKVLGIPMGQMLNKTILMNAYKKAVIKAHPDKGGSKEAFIAVQTAKEYLEKFV